MRLLTNYFSKRLAALGYPTDNIEYSLSYAQGDGVAFYGSVSDEALALLATNMLPEGDPFRTALEREDLEVDASLHITRDSWSTRYARGGTMAVSGGIYVYPENEDEVTQEEVEAIKAAFYEFAEGLQEDAAQLALELRSEGYKLIEAGNPLWFPGLDAEFSKSYHRYTAPLIDKTIGRFRVVVKLMEDPHFDPYDYDDPEKIIKQILDGELCYYEMVAEVYDVKRNLRVGLSGVVDGIMDTRDFQYGREVAKELVAEAIKDARTEINRLAVRTA